MKQDIIEMPNDENLEESILSTCFVCGPEISEVIDLVNPEYFYNTSYREIFKAMVDITFHADSVDLVSVVTKLKDREKLDKVGGAAFISRIVDAPVAVDIPYACKKLEEKFLLRKTLEFSYATIKKCQHGQDEFDDIVNYYLDCAHKIAEGTKAGDPVISMESAAMEASDIYDKRYKETRIVTGVPSGIHDLDYMTFGFHPGDLTLIAARPGMGKTALALNILRHAAKKGHGGLIMSLEMPAQQLFDRLVAMETRINGMKIRIGDFDEDEFSRVTDAVNSLYKLPIFVDERGGLTFNEIRKTIRRQKKAHPEISFVLVDHIQLVHGSNPHNRNLEIGEISMGLKTLAKELKIPIIALAQLNRELERRNNPFRRPKLSDLRDSGNLEQDADNVLFIYRPSVYGDNLDPNDPERTIEISESDCEIIIAKQRQGITGKVPCNFFDKIQTFTSLTKLSPDELYQKNKGESSNE
jgi:replicative DNA helicase